MAKWFVAAKKADFNAIAKKFGVTPVLARIIRNRDITEREDIRKFLFGGLEDMYSPFLMKDMGKSVDLLLQKIEEGARIRIIGDYDVDGICSAFILLKGLRKLGGKVDTVIPHRIKDGYGLNDTLIEAAAEAGIDTIVTCDNGIAAAPQIALAKSLGMTVIVTDHHEVPFKETQEGERLAVLPQADAVVNPKQADCPYPYKQICGGMVAFKVIQALLNKESISIQEESVAFQEKGIRGITQEEKNKLLEELLCFSAFATICDVMELKDENRIVVKQGLEKMKQTTNLGLRALIEVNGIQEKELTPYHMGFILGPSLNATGRLDTAERALALFNCEDWKEAVNIAADLKSLNDSRKEMTKQGLAEAIAMIETGGMKEDKVLVVYLPDCHESLAGIIAGRVREKYGKPAFVLTKGEEEIKGSGRSIDAYHMYEEMCKCKELFIKFGGHKLAAGLSMKEKDISVIRQRLIENADLTEADFEEKVHIDVPMPLSYASREFIKELYKLEPFGVGNPKPLFAQKGIRLLSGKIMGKNSNVGKYIIEDAENNPYEMIYFGDLEAFHEFLENQWGKEKTDALYQGGVRGKEEILINIAYYPTLNYYGGRESVQIVMQYYC